MTVQVKICGVREAESLNTAVAGGARYVGFVFYDRSPRYVAPQQAAEMARLLPTGVRAVGLFVDADDDFLEHIVGQVPLDLIQAHGKEPPERVAAIKATFAIPVMKAFRIGSVEDLDAVAPFVPVADRLLFDAKPPANVAALPGGNGIAFDWTLLAGRQWAKPWMLAGGITPANLTDAVRASGATAVDVSSGVEDRPGHKDPARIRDFLAIAGRL